MIISKNELYTLYEIKDGDTYDYYIGLTSYANLLYLYGTEERQTKDELINYIINESFIFEELKRINFIEKE